MSATESKAKSKDWQIPLVTGMSIGAGLAAARTVEANFASSLGPWNALLVSMLVAAAVAAVISLSAGFLIKRNRSA
jgi:hypothetical protein